MSLSTNPALKDFRRLDPKAESASQKNGLKQSKYTFFIDLTIGFLLQGRLGLWGVYRTSSQSITKTLAPILLLEDFSKDNSCFLSQVTTTTNLYHHYQQNYNECQNDYPP